MTEADGHDSNQHFEQVSSSASANARGSAIAARISELEGQLATALDELRVLRRKPRLGLVWEDQSETVENQLAHELPVLVRVPERHVGEDEVPHVLIEGDNLHALACLQYTHAGRVDVIYIDPPYNTGAKEGDRFRYDDNYVGKDDEWRHSKWLSFMDRRIRLAKELLAPGGFLAVSIDDNEMAHLRLLLDSHFGEGNVKTVVVKMSEAAGVKMAAVKNAGGIPKLKEYLIIAKPGGVKGFSFTPVPKETWDKNYRNVLQGLTSTTRDRIRELAERGEISDYELAEVEKALAQVKYRPARAVAADEGADVSGKAKMDAWLLKNAWRVVRDTNGGGTVMRLVEGRRKTGTLPKQEVVAVRTKTGRLYLAVTRTAQTILFADDNLTTHPGDLWTDIKTTSLSKEGGVDFKNGKKPLSLLRRVIDSHSNPNAVVLDFFAGSGSTAHAVAELNALDAGKRQAILVTNDEGRICSEVAFPRIRGVLTGKLPNGKTQDALPGALRGYRCEFVKISRNRDAMLRRLSGRAADIISIRENAYDTVDEQKGRYVVLGNGGRRIVVWCDWADDGLAEILAAHADAAERRLYMFGFGESVDAEVAAAHPDWQVEALPEPLRAALERAYRRSSAR